MEKRKKLSTVADEGWFDDVEQETQSLFEDNEVSIQNEWNQCNKKAGHEGLILCSNFMKNPETYFKQANLNYDGVFNDYITANIKLTVRLAVKFVSNGRPAIYKNLYKHRGTKYTFTGSGVVVSAKVDGKVYISTATHVVFDHAEAEYTTAELFYHNRDRRQEVKKLKGVRLEKRSIYGDSCILECVTTGLILCQDLISFLDVQRKLFKAVPRYPNKIMVISHPHGMPKYISFGTCSQVETKSETIFSLSSLKYTATTCPGSSGGPVFILNDNFRERFNTNIVGDYPLHSGANSGALQYSGIAHKPTLLITSRRNTADDSDYTAFARGDDENSGESLEGQVKDVRYCKKNPGHKNFVPVNKFCLEHFPAEYRDNDLYDYIKALGDLTGRLTVQFTSPKRPEFVPGTKDPYPCYKIRETRHLRTGTATVVSVMKIDNSFQTCPCPRCDYSSTPHEEFFLVYVLTAAHVVFDNSEARKCTIRSWFNDDNSPVVSMYGWRVVEYDDDLTHDRKLVEFVTHDIEMGDKLLETINRLHQLDIKLTEQYKDFDKLAIIISHPHGFSKKISVGRLINSETVSTNFDFENVRYQYTTCTCPGSSGAPVFIVGEGIPHVVEHYLICHVHRGVGRDGKNVSAFGLDNYLVFEHNVTTSAAFKESSNVESTKNKNNSLATHITAWLRKLLKIYFILH